MSGHLGPAASAFLDGALEHGPRDEVLAHLAHCPACRAELDVQRGLRSVLRELPGPCPSQDLADRLLAVARESAVPAGRAAVAVVGSPVRSRLGRPHRRRVRRRSSTIRRAALGGLLVAIGLGTSVGLAGPAPRGPVAPVDPAGPQFVHDHSGTSSQVPFDDLDVVVASLDGAAR